MRRYKKFLSLLLAVILLVAALPFSASAAASSFPDVPAGIWYEQYLDKIMWAQQQMHTNRVISGTDKGTFEPDRNVTRGEWLKMLIEAEVLTGSSAPVTDVTNNFHWAAKWYYFALEQNLLVADVYSNSAPMFPATAAALNEPITRYEMAVILNNICTNVGRQKTVTTSEPQSHITDYAVVPASYTTAVEQMYGKGYLVGDENGCFNGANSLTRGAAAVVLYKYLFVDTINGDGLQDWAEYPKVTSNNTSYLDPSLSFAHWLQNGHVDGWGNIDAEAKTRLFGNPNKSYFSSAAEASGYMTTVSVPIWTMDKAGNKYASTTSITVHYLVADEIRSIFQMIYDDPEQFPIYGGWSAGGSRYTDTMRHSWGCAIDINAYYNCECTINWNTYNNRVTCGYGWWPIGHNDTAFAGSMSGPSAYSIGANPGEYGYSVVKAFATYGWGWGGNGYSLKSNGNQKYDFMHFSVLKSGG